MLGIITTPPQSCRTTPGLYLAHVGAILQQHAHQILQLHRAGRQGAGHLGRLSTGSLVGRRVFGEVCMATAAAGGCHVHRPSRLGGWDVPAVYKTVRGQAYGASAMPACCCGLPTQLAAKLGCTCSAHDTRRVRTPAGANPHCCGEASSTSMWCSAGLAHACNATSMPSSFTGQSWGTWAVHSSKCFEACCSITAPWQVKQHMQRRDGERPASW